MYFYLTKDEMENNIRSEIKNKNLDDLIEQTLIDEKGNLIIEYDNIKFEVATTKNNDEYKNISIIKLGNKKLYI